MPRPYNRKKPIEVGVEPTNHPVVIPDLSIQEVEAVWLKCCPMPGFSQLDIHQFAKEIINTLKGKI